MDIIFFAALAFFIFFKLNKQLGKIDEEERKKITDKISKKKAQIIDIQSRVTRQAPQESPIKTIDSSVEELVEIESLVNLDASSKEIFSEITQKCNITAEFFVEGMKSAFEMVIKAFTSSDLETLKFLLSEKIFKGFEGAINDRKSKSQNLVTNLIAIDKVEVVAVILSKNIASITVKIISQQINYVTDQDEKVIEGEKGEISDITDIWTFQKDVTSPNPNWIVSATGA